MISPEENISRSRSIPKASGTWFEENKSIVEAQRLKIEAMLSKSKDDFSHTIHEDRNCWWLEDFDTHRSNESKVSFSTVVDHKLISDNEWSSECLSDSDGAAFDLYYDSEDRNSSSSSSDEDSGRDTVQVHESALVLSTRPETVRCGRARSRIPPTMSGTIPIPGLQAKARRTSPPAGPYPDAGSAAPQPRAPAGVSAAVIARDEAAVMTT